MPLSKKKLRESGAAVFTRNYRGYVEKTAAHPDRLVTFRAARSWSSAYQALHGLETPLRLYLACNGGGPRVEYVADLVVVHLNPDPNAEYTKQLLGLQLQETEGEGLWEGDKGQVKTLYVLKGCRKLETPLPITALLKLADGEPLAEGFRYSYAMVHPEPGTTEDSSDYPDTVPPGTYSEGSVSTVRVNRFERSPRAREACLQHYGYECSVCGTLLEDVYGEAAERLIHVHHLVPLAQIASTYKVNPVKDLRPVCPNCHAVLHRTNPPYAIEEVRSWLSLRHRGSGNKE